MSSSWSNSLSIASKAHFCCNIIDPILKIWPVCCCPILMNLLSLLSLRITHNSSNSTSYSLDQFVVVSTSMTSDRKPPRRIIFWPGGILPYFYELKEVKKITLIFIIRINLRVKHEFIEVSLHIQTIKLCIK